MTDQNYLPLRPQSEEEVLAVARAAGLDTAITFFAEDVRAAAVAARKALTNEVVSGEPWPPMHLRTE